MTTNTAWASDVGPGGGDDAVCQRRVDPLDPRRAPGTDDEADHGAEHERAGQPVVIVVSGPASGQRERHGKDEADQPAGADGVPVQPQHFPRAAHYGTPAMAPGRTVSPGRACPG